MKEKLTVILDCTENPQLARASATALLASGPRVLAVAGEGQETPRLPEGIELVQLDGSRAQRLNETAKLTQTPYLFFARPQILTDTKNLALLLEALERDMSIGCCAPKLLTTDDRIAPSEFILIQDECKRRPIDVLLKPVTLGRTEDWAVPPLDGIAYLADALMVRTVAFWGAGGWDEAFEGSSMDLTLGLALKEQLWRCVFVQEAAMVTLRPGELQFDPTTTRHLVERWFGRFLPHALRTPDGVVRNHPWWAAGGGTLPCGHQRTGDPFDPLPSSAEYRLGDIPGERCSVVIVTYNSMETIKDCLKTVVDHLGDFDQVIVVDNGSRDGTPQFLASLQGHDPRLTVILNERNLGFSEGCNVGIGVAQGQYIVLLNPDTTVPEGWLGRMRAYFEDDRVGAVGPISDGVCGMQRFEHHFPRKMPSGMSALELHQLAGQVNSRRGIQSKLLIGFCLVLRKSALDEVGLLDPDLFLGFDDLDMSWRLRLAGYKLVIATDVLVLHKVHASFKTERAEVVQELSGRSADALARKLIEHYGAGNVPSQAELWGIDWFEPQVRVWEASDTTFQEPISSIL